jgi:hypothetical protein
MRFLKTRTASPFAAHPTVANAANKKTAPTHVGTVRFGRKNKPAAMQKNLT